MESYLVAAIALGGLYHISNSNKENFKQSKTKANQLVIPTSYTNSKPLNLENKSEDNGNTLPSSSVTNSPYMSLTGEKINTKSFKHNNMTPFYGAKNTGLTYNISQTDTILDNMVGSGSTQINKGSQAPLFKPQENMNWTHGAPNNSDFYKSRMESVLTQRKHNEKPWTSENVGPGLGKSYASEGSHGFNAGIMSRDEWKPKTVDDLRTTNNPKQTFSLKDHEGPLSSIVQNRAEQAKVNKNRPDRHFHHGPQRYFTSNVTNSSTLRAENILPDMNRATTTVEYMGIPSSAAFSTATKSNQNFQKKKKDHIYGEVMGIPSALSSQMTLQNQDAYMNNNTYRAKNMANMNEQFYGNIQGVVNAMGEPAPIKDDLRPTKKELIFENVNSTTGKGSYVSKVGAGGEYVYDPDDIPKETIRQTTNYSVSDNNIPIFYDKVTDNIVNGESTIGDTNRSSTTAELRGTPGATGYGIKHTEGVYNQRNNVNKQTTNWTPSGNISKFNNYINMKTVSVREIDNQQSRQNVPDHIKDVMPNQELLGKVSMPVEPPSIIGDRLDSNLLEAFKKNPFTHSLQGYAK